MDFENAEKARAAEIDRTIANTKQATPDYANRACREMTVGEALDRQIETAERVLWALKDLKVSLPGSYLNSGSSRIAAILK